MSKIEWTGETWNPIVGCSIVSPGCTNCYAMRMAARLEAMAGSGKHRWTEPPDPGERLSHYVGTTKPRKAGPVWTGKLALAPDTILTKPLRRRTPTTYFVNSMSDLFHEDVPDAWIDRMFAAQEAADYEFEANGATNESDLMQEEANWLATLLAQFDAVFAAATN